LSNQETREERNARQRRERNALVVKSIQQVDAETYQHLTPDVPVTPPDEASVSNTERKLETPKGLLPTIRKVIARIVGKKRS